MRKNRPSRQPSPASGEEVRGKPAALGAGRPGGFTLTELLVVIAIIAMLVALTSVAVMRALGTAKQTRMKTEVDQLDAAFKAYKEKYGSYPPCDLRIDPMASPGDPLYNAPLRQHVARAFPRYDLANLPIELGLAGIDVDNFRPDQTLVFWLRGFSSDPLHPFVSLDDKQISGGVVLMQPVKRTPLYDFDTTRLVSLSVSGVDTVPSYFPAGVNVSSTPSVSVASPFAVWSSGGAPYLYWDAQSYQDSAPSPPSTEAVPFVFNLSSPGPPLYADAGEAVPYWLDTNINGLTADFAGVQQTEDWVNPESFQIIATGSDGRYGAGTRTSAPCYPTGGGYDSSSNLADDDNVTNFCTAARLEDAKP